MRRLAIGVVAVLAGLAIGTPTIGIASVYEETILADNPIGYWRLGEMSGVVAYDSSPNHLDGTYHGGVAIDQAGALPKDCNTSALFDGLTGYVDVGVRPELNQLTNDFTIEAWVKLDDQNQGSHVILSASSKDNVYEGYTFAPTTRPGFGTNGFQSYMLDYELPMREWLHLVVVFDAFNDASFFYNGVFLGLVEGDRPAVANTQTLNIGRNPRTVFAGHHAEFDGGLDEVAIYGRSLSREEIREHYLAAFAENQSVEWGGDLEGDWHAGSWLCGESPNATTEVLVRKGSVFVSSNGEAESLSVHGGALGVQPAGSLSVTADLNVDRGGECVFGIGTAGTGTIEAGTANLTTDSILTFQVDGASPFRAGTFTLITADHIDGTFGSTSGLGRYVSEGDNMDGLIYTDTALTVSIEWDLHPGDANLSGKTDLTDFNIWNANKFTLFTDWTTADFNGDGVTDLSDFNIWNAHKFTVANGGAAPAPIEVPEPGAVVMLGCAVVGMAVWWRRNRGAACGNISIASTSGTLPDR